MSNSSRNSFKSSDQWSVISGQRLFFHWSLVTLSLVTVLGCESLQKKFTRKPKTPSRPSPIIAFQDYTRAMTPLDRYRKHYVLFDYWNDQLLDVLQDGNRANPKRIQRTSTESLSELEALQGLLRGDLAAQVSPLVEERRKMHQELATGSYTAFQLNRVRRALELQTRQVRRRFYWRYVEDQLQEDAPSDAGSD